MIEDKTTEELKKRAQELGLIVNARADQSSPKPPAGNKKKDGQNERRTCLKTRMAPAHSRNESLTALEDKVDRRLRDTKPIWEQALKELMDTREEVRAGFHNLEQQIGVLSRDMVRLRDDQDGDDERRARLEGKNSKRPGDRGMR